MLIRILLLAAAIFLSGCTDMNYARPIKPAFEPRFTTMSPAERQRTLAAVQSWYIKGALSTRQYGKDHIVYYYWDQRGPDHYHIRVASELNVYQVDIYGTGGQVVLRRGRSPEMVARTPEELLQDAVGWTFPMRDLFYWIRGIPAPGRKQAHYDAYGHLMELWQNRWDIKYVEYSVIQGVDLPRYIKLYNGDTHTRVTIVIKQWVVK